MDRQPATRKPPSIKDRGPNISKLVGLRGLKLNGQLVAFLRKHQAELEQSSPAHAPPSYHSQRRWRIRDRLSRQDIANIVRAFKAGAPKHVLAERHNMNLRSLKKLLREEGVKRKSWKDRQPQISSNPTGVRWKDEATIEKRYAHVGNYIWAIEDL